MQAKVETSNQSDEVLVVLATQGNMEAFGELLRRHQQRCVNVATVFLRNRADAEDETQNAFSKAVEHIDQYRGDAEFSTWLSQIVANQCLMLMRVRRRARFVYLDEPIERERSPRLELPASGPDPEGELGCGQMTETLRAEIHRIPPILRDVMVLRDIQELPMTEVAEKLGITVPAAKSRLLRARLELRVRLARHCKGIGNSAPLSRTAAPLNRVARHSAVQGC